MINSLYIDYYNNKNLDYFNYTILLNLIFNILKIFYMLIFFKNNLYNFQELFILKNNYLIKFKIIILYVRFKLRLNLCSNK